jgi:hypothetical protein
VQTGLSSDSLTEVVSGLQEGDVVVINGTTTATTTSNASAGNMGAMGAITGGAPAGGPPPGAN